MHTLHWIVVTILILIFSNKAPPEGTPLEDIDLTSDCVPVYIEGVDPYFTTLEYRDSPGALLEDILFPADDTYITLEELECEVRTTHLWCPPQI